MTHTHGRTPPASHGAPQQPTRARSAVRAPWLIIAIAVVLSTAAPPGAAFAGNLQRPLFDRFSLDLEGSYVGLQTKIRLDSETLGEGTTLAFEDDLDLDRNKQILTLGLAWQIGRRHRLAARWQEVNRSATSQALTEIQWGDEIIPVSADIRLGFDLSQLGLDYTYYPWVRERWAAGFGLGIRVLEITAALSWQGEVVGSEETAEGTGPLPYVNFEYRRLLSERWRLLSKVGWLSVKIGDIDGGQWIVGLSAEYLLGDHWAFGAGVNAATVDVDWEGLERPDGGNELRGHVDLDIWDFSLRAKLRF